MKNRFINIDLSKMQIPSLRLRRTSKGFTLIESMVLVVIFAIAVMTFYKTYTLVMAYSLETKHRIAAVEFATAEMEILRNTPYEDIILDPAFIPPDGSAVSASSGTGLNYDRTTTINGITHRILTEIYYVDDAEDGVGTSNDIATNDYKNVIITILWGTGVAGDVNTNNSISLTSFFVPPSGNETAVINGAVSVNIVDSNGDAVSGALVEIDDINGVTVPNVDESANTDVNGNVLFEDVPISMDMYQITVSKSGSEYIQTIASGTTPEYPTYTHASVLSGTITTMTIVQDINPDFSLITKDVFGNALTDINFTFTGGRMLGLDTDSNPVYVNTDRTATSSSTSGEEGEVDCDDVTGYIASTGKYNFTLNETGYVLWKFNPISDKEYNFVEATGNLKNLDDDYYNGDGVDDNEMIIIDESVNGVIVSVTDSITEDPFECATVRLENTTPDYDQLQQTDIYGKVYFPMDVDEDGILDTDEELDSSETYDITVSAPDCVDDCTSNCDNDCIEHACVEGCVSYEDDCTNYYEYASGLFYKYYADETDTVKPENLQSKIIELSPDDS